MKKVFFYILVAALSFGMGYYFPSLQTEVNPAKILQTSNPQKRSNMKLGAFSVSLSVKDIKVSKKFYESLGFTVLAGSISS